MDQKWKKAFVLFLIIGSFSRAIAQKESVFQLVENDGYFLIVNYSLEAAVAPEEVLKIYVGQKITADLPSVAGTYEWNDSTLIFKPRFGFYEGMSYCAVLKGIAHPFQFTIPEKVPDHLTEVEGVYPSADTIPANLLKVYIQFSRPMSEGMAYEHIFLVQENGDTVYQPFLPLQPELWDEKRERLTLWVDPGRVKRDLGPNLLHGAPLLAGQHYQLCVSKRWEDKNGHQLANDFKYAFFVGTPDRVKPEPKYWKIKRPIKNTLDVVEIDFGEPMDYALANHLICVVNEEGLIVEGVSTLIDQERRWRFIPTKKWAAGSYQIRVEAILEDLAGNNLNRLFDRDLRLANDKDGHAVFHWISLEIKG